MANAVTFWKGTKAKYEALGTYLETRIYFCEDTQELFKGSVLFGRGDIKTALDANVIAGLAGDELATAKAILDYIGTVYATSAELEELADTVAELDAALGGTASGTGSISSKVADLETATNVSVTKDAPIVVDVNADTASGSDVLNKINSAYQPTVQFQGVDVANLASVINFIGIGNVSKSADGKVLTIRLGENLNCSTWNSTDGISTATVTGAYGTSGITAGVTPSSAFANTSASSVRVCSASDGTNAVYSITATPGSTGTTASGANTKNGNEVHFDDKTSCYFKVKIVEGKNTTATEYLVGPIIAGAGTSTSNGTTYYGKIGSTEYKGIKCVVFNFGDEPKKANGATGYAGNVHFTILPETLYADKSTDFQLTGIEMVKIAIKDGESETTSVANWPATSTNAKHFFLSAKDDKGTAVTYSKPTMSNADYTLSLGTAITYHGVTYYKAADSKVAGTCTATNIGFPASVSTKATMTATGGTWFNKVTDTTTSKFTTWSDKNGTAMTYASTESSLNIGDWTGAGISITGTNYIGTSTAATKSVTEKFLICDADGYITSDHGPFEMSTEDLGTDEFMVFDGCLVYPSRDFSGYQGNSTYVAPGKGGVRSYTKTFDLTGTITGGTVTLSHKSVSGGLKSALTAGTIKVFVLAKDKKTWRDVSENGIGQATSTYNTTSTKLDFVFAFDTDYPNATTGTKVKVEMTAAVADIKSITLA